MASPCIGATSRLLCRFAPSKQSSDHLHEWRSHRLLDDSAASNKLDVCQCDNLQAILSDSEQAFSYPLTPRSSSETSHLNTDPRNIQ